MKGNISCCLSTIIVFLCCHLSANGHNNLLKLHLPDFITPLRYDLTIKTDPNDEIIDHKGEVRITIQCTQETKEIVVNRKYLKIEETDVKVIKLQAKDEEVGETVGVGGHDYNLELERYIIKVEKSLEKDKFYLVTIPFVKKVDIDLPYHGYIKRTYESQTRPGYFKPLVYTKMGPIDARTVFPSLDQINMKTPFRIKHEHPKSMKALSNANIDHRESVSNKPDWIRDVFEDTVAMTTYSVTFTLLKFISKKTIEPSSKVEIRVWSDEKMMELIDYVFPVVFHSLKFYFEIFKVPYGFEKLDVVILPDERIKVKESYGLIILSQEFVRKTIELSSNEYEMVSKLSQAISQQWIDYRVTMLWWDQNWLHRGLNRFLQSVCVNQILPEWELSMSVWDILDSFVQIQRNEKKKFYNPILTLDEFPTDSLERETAETHEKIFQLMRMTDFFLGPEVFRERIQTYVNTFEFSHSSLPKIWEAFGKTSRIKQDNYNSKTFSVEEVLKSWLSQKGLPLVDVKQDYNTKLITVTQTPFVSLQLEEEKTPRDDTIPTYVQSWMIPLSYTTQSEMNFKNIEVRGWLTEKGPLEIHVDDMKKNEWIVLNLQLNVLGHVNYTHDNWQAIQNYLLDPRKYFKFDVLTRVRFIHDMMALAEAEKLSYSFVFKTLKYLRHEKHTLPLKVAVDEFDIIYSRLLGTDNMPEYFNNYVVNILEPFYKKEFISLDLVNFFETDNVDYQRKILIVGASCKYGVAGCADKTALLLEKAWKTENLIKKPRELRRIVLCNSVKRGRPHIYDSLFDAYMRDKRKPNDWAIDIIDALCCSNRSKDIKELLYSSTNIKNNIYWSDRFRIFENLSKNNEAFEHMMTFFKDNFEKLNEMYAKGGPVTTVSYLRILIQLALTSEEIKELTDFATSMQLDWLTQEVSDTIINTKKKKMWLSSFKKHMEENLTKPQY